MLHHSCGVRGAGAHRAVRHVDGDPAGELRVELAVDVRVEVPAVAQVVDPAAQHHNGRNTVSWWILPGNATDVA